MATLSVGSLIWRSTRRRWKMPTKQQKIKVKKQKWIYEVRRCLCLYNFIFLKVHKDGRTQVMHLRAGVVKMSSKYIVKMICSFIYFVVVDDSSIQRKSMGFNVV